MSRRLYRNTNYKMVAGVCSGLADYFDIDPTIIRLIWIIFSFGSFGGGLIAYIIAALVIPVETGYIER